MSPLIKSLLLTAVVLLLDGCGPTAEQACTEAAAAQCAQLDACWQGQGVLRIYGDSATCQAQSSQACLARLTPISTGATPAGRERCAAQQRLEACSDYFSNQAPAACATPAGALENGEGCAFSAECQSSFCAVQRGAVCGVCADPPQWGDSCLEVPSCPTGQICAAKFDPSGNVLEAVCAGRSGPGAGCDLLTPCAVGFACVGAAADGSVQGTCMAQGSQPGVTCDAAKKTAADCDPHANLFCNRMTNQCTALQFALANQPCGTIEGGQVVTCAAEGKCIRAAGAASGICLPAAQEGAACDTDPNGPNPACAMPGVCLTVEPTGGSGVCALPSAASCH